MNNSDCLNCWDFIGNESGYGKVEPCLHVFCMKCIQKWIKVSGSEDCESNRPQCVRVGLCSNRSTEEIIKKILN